MGWLHGVRVRDLGANIADPVGERASPRWHVATTVALLLCTPLLGWAADVCGVGLVCPIDVPGALICCCTVGAELVQSLLSVDGSRYCLGLIGRASDVDGASA